MAAGFTSSSYSSEAPTVDTPLKYPRTPHLPFSPGVSSDDVVLSSTQVAVLPFLSRAAVVTEKLDGGNCSIYNGKVYARTTSAVAMHPSFGPIKQLAAEISYILPRTIQLFGENMFGIHSIEYNDLEAYFYAFAALREGKEWVSWEHVVELAMDAGVPTVPVLSEGMFSSLEELESMMMNGMEKNSKCGTCFPEGFVVRSAEGFTYDRLGRNTAKYVRAGHVQTEDSWRRTWKQAKLSRAK